MKTKELMEVVKASFSREENTSYRIVSQKVAAKLASKLEDIVAEAEDNGFLTKPKDATCPVCGETITARKFAVTFARNQKNRFLLDEVDVHMLEEHGLLDKRLLKKLSRKQRTNEEKPSKKKEKIKTTKDEASKKTQKNKNKKEKEVEIPIKSKKTRKEISVDENPKVKVIRKGKKSKVNEEFDD